MLERKYAAWAIISWQRSDSSPEPQNISGSNGSIAPMTMISCSSSFKVPVVDQIDQFTSGLHATEPATDDHKAPGWTGTTHSPARI
jgi:hypothetical protein